MGKLDYDKKKGVDIDAEMDEIDRDIYNTYDRAQKKALKESATMRKAQYKNELEGPGHGKMAEKYADNADTQAFEMGRRKRLLRERKK